MMCVCVQFFYLFTFFVPNLFFFRCANVADVWLYRLDYYYIYYDEWSYNKKTKCTHTSGEMERKIRSYPHPTECIWTCKKEICPLYEGKVIGTCNASRIKHVSVYCMLFDIINFLRYTYIFDRRHISLPFYYTHTINGHVQNVLQWFNSFACSCVCHSHMYKALAQIAFAHTHTPDPLHIYAINIIVFPTIYLEVDRVYVSNVAMRKTKNSKINTIANRFQKGKPRNIRLWSSSRLKVNKPCAVSVCVCMCERVSEWCTKRFTNQQMLRTNINE